MITINNNNSDVSIFGHSHEDHSHESSLNITSTKLICMIILGLGSFISGNLPLVLSNLYDNKRYNSELERYQANRRKQKIISVLLSFTGGVIFCIVFIHLLPEVSEMFEDLSEHEEYRGLPEYISQALLCTGFFLIYFIEEVAHKIIHSNPKKKEINKKGDLNNLEHRYLEGSPSLNHLTSGINGPSADDEKKAIFMKNVIHITEEASKNLSIEESQIIVNCIKKAINVQECEFSGKPFTVSGIPIRNSGENDTNGHNHELELLNNARNSVRSFLLALALSIHELFEGMAIGIEMKNSAVWLMLLGVGSHKILLAVCMGIEMVAGNINKVTHILYISMFAAVTPLGMAAGWFVSNEHELLSAIFQSIASGTLLYVLFYEVLKRKSEDNDNSHGVDSGFTCLFAILLGFMLMTTLEIIADDL